MTRKIKITVGIICLALAIGVFGYVGYVYYRQYRAEKDMAGLAPVPEPTPTPKVKEETPSIIPHRYIDWEALNEENPDIYAWLTVPGTNINYPVLQHADDDSFYLMHNLDGSYGYPGCIYTEGTYNTKDFTDANTVMYGHKMKNGSMFAGLHDYREEAFFEENPYIFVYTPEKAYGYEIFAAIQIDDRHILAGYNLDFPEAVVEYEEILLNASDGIKPTEDIEAGDRLLTLSTCVSQSESDNRFLLQGKLIEEYDKTTTR